MKYVTHDFYCLNCGKLSIPISRKCSKLKESLHRKRLYCPWCKVEVNHIECSNPKEVIRFKEDFLKGIFKKEAEDSIAFIAAERMA